MAAACRSWRVLTVSELAVGDRAGWARSVAGRRASVRTHPATVARTSCAREAAETSTAHRLGSPSSGVGQGVCGEGSQGWSAGARVGDRHARAQFVDARSARRVAGAKHNGARTDEDEPFLDRVARPELDNARPHDDDNDNDNDNDSSVEEAVACERSRGYAFPHTGVCSRFASLSPPSRSSSKGLRPIPSA